MSCWIQPIVIFISCYHSYPFPIFNKHNVNRYFCDIHADDGYRCDKHLFVYQAFLSSTLHFKQQDQIAAEGVACTFEE